MKALETMEERCKSLTSGFRHTSLKWKKNLCPGQDSNLHLPAILVGHDIHYTCGNFIDVSRSNAVNPRDIFHLYPIIIYYYYHYYYCYYYYYRSERGEPSSKFLIDIQKQMHGVSMVFSAMRFSFVIHFD